MNHENSMTEPLKYKIKLIIQFDNKLLRAPLHGLVMALALERLVELTFLWREML